MRAVEEPSRLGHRRAAVGADQPARRGRAAGRASADGAAPKPAEQCMTASTAARPASASSTTATSWPARTVGRCLAALGAEVIKVERPAAAMPAVSTPVFEGRPERLLPAAEHGQAGAVRQLQGPARPRDDAQAGRHGRRVRRELPPRRARTSSGLGYEELSRAQSEPRLLLGLGLWPYRSRCASRGLRPDRRSEERRSCRWSARPARRRRCCASRSATCTPASTRVAAINAALLGRVKSGPRPAHRHGAVRHAGVDARLRGAVLHHVGRHRGAGADRPRHAAVDALRRVPRHGRRSRDRRAGRRRLEALCRAGRGDGGPPAFGADTRSTAPRAQRESPGDPRRASSLGRGAAGRRSASQRSTRIDVPCAKVQRIDEVLADPQIIARGMLVEQEHPVLGKVRLPNLPFRFSDCDTTIREVGAATRPAQSRTSPLSSASRRRDRRHAGRRRAVRRSAVRRTP